MDEKDQEAQSTLSADQPIRRREEDALGRGALVELLKEEILDAPTDDGFVMGLTAPWGEGKTSVLNLVAGAVEKDVVVVHFNPWLFTDAQALVVRFFSELGAQIRGEQRLRAVGKRLAAYGQAVAPIGSLFAGPAANLVGQSLGALAAVDSKGIDDQRRELKADLKEQEQRILVLVDDIDRLHDQEILDLMRLVKLVGDLPFVTYLLAFDRPYVEEAIGRAQLDGRSYLEKVLQVTYDLPAIRPAELQAVLLEQLNKAIKPIEHLPVRPERWSEVLSRAMLPFFGNLRDVARYVSGVSAPLRLVGKEVALEDILALETLRVFEPGVHQQLPQLVAALTKQRPGILVDNEAEEKKELALIETTLGRASRARETKVRALLATLFPRAGDVLGAPGYQSDSWRAYRQVADPGAFRTYLHASIDPGSASYGLVVEAIEALGDPKAFRELLSEVEEPVLGDLLQRLPDLRERIEPNSAASGVSELLALESRLSNEREGLRPAPQFYLKSALRAVLESVTKTKKRERILVEAFEKAQTESERLSLLHWFGSFEERERKQPELEMLSEKVTAELQGDVRRRVREKDGDALLAEEQFHWLVLEGFGSDEDGRKALRKVDDRLMLEILRACVRVAVTDDRRFFNLADARRLMTRESLVEVLAKLKADATLSAKDSETLKLAAAALEEESDSEPVGSG